MRARNIKPGFFKNELLGTQDPVIGLTFIGLWCLADKKGRLEDRPMRIRAELFPYRESLDINGYLTELERLGFVDRYVVSGKGYIQIVNFELHQYPHNTEKASVIPPKPLKTTEKIEFPLDNGSLTVNPPKYFRENPLNPDSPNPESLNPDLSLAKKNNDQGEDQPKPKRKKQEPKIYELPFSSPAFLKAWGDWCEYRKQRRLPLTPAATEKQLKKISEIGETRSIAMIEFSIMQNYQGLYEPNGARTSARYDRDQDIANDIAEVMGGLVNG